MLRQGLDLWCAAGFEWVYKYIYICYMLICKLQKNNDQRCEHTGSVYRLKSDEELHTVHCSNDPLLPSLSIISPVFAGWPQRTWLQPGREKPF